MELKKEVKVAIKPSDNNYIIMGRTINAQKMPPKKKAIQGVEWERRSPRVHKSSTREIEVNVRKSGTGPQGRGGKTITREQQLSSSESSAESDKGDERSPRGHKSSTREIEVNA